MSRKSSRSSDRRNKVCHPWRRVPGPSRSDHCREGTMRHYAIRDCTRARMASLIGSGRSGQDCTTCSNSASVMASAAHFAAQLSRRAEFAGFLEVVRIPPLRSVGPMVSVRDFRARKYCRDHNCDDAEQHQGNGIVERDLHPIHGQADCSVLQSVSIGIIATLPRQH